MSNDNSYAKRSVAPNDRRKVKRSSLIPYIELLRVAGLVSVDFTVVDGRIIKA